MFLREEVLHFIVVKSFRKMFKKYTSIWNLCQLLAVIFIAVTNIFILIVGQGTPFALCFISKSLIWVIVLGFLKGTNLHLSMVRVYELVKNES